MWIGSNHVSMPAILAPMAGITDRPFRQLCRRFGAGLAVSEMTTSDPRLRHSATTAQRCDFDTEPPPVYIQILGADPARMADAARFHVDRGAHMIDINMGCPAKKVCNVWAGSALMRDEMLVGKLLHAVVSAVAVPVTLKIRTGWDSNNRNAPTIAHIAEDTGIQALTIHGRTREQRFKGTAEYETIAEIKANICIPVIANGDIDSPQKAAHVLHSTGADAVMIGRAAQGRPWIFQEILHFLDGRHWEPLNHAEIKTIVLEHLTALYAFYGEQRGPRIARKHLAWYSRYIEAGEAFRERINQVTEPKTQLSITEDYFH